MKLKYAIYVHFSDGQTDTSDLLNVNNKTESEMMAWAFCVFREKCKDYPNFEVCLIKRKEPE